MQMQDKRVPVTLLTGFLGAGKTTVLNHLLNDASAGRIAVIINEFGDVGLDHDLVETATEDIILLDSGCLCCSIRGDLSRSISDLMARRQRGDLAFDRIVIETTGIADPGPVLHSMVVDTAIARHARMDGVVTVADAATGPQILDSQFEAVHQIAMADLIVISKADLVTPGALERFQARLAGINGTAGILCADHGKVPVARLFGLSGMWPDVTGETIKDWLGAVTKPDPLAGLSGFAPKPRPALEPSSLAHHDNRISSAAIELEGPIPASVFDFWLDTLVALKGPDLLRMKGIVHVEGMEWPFVFHGVQHIFDAPVPLKSWSGKEKVSRIVVIARDMAEDDLRGSLETLRMRQKSEAQPVAGMMSDSLAMPS